MRWEFVCVTTTVTRGEATYCFNFCVRSALSCMGVKPDACTSFRSGIEIIPSARTGTVAVKSGSFQTEMCNMSFGPISYGGSSNAEPVATETASRGAGTTALTEFSASAILWPGHGNTLPATNKTVITQPAVMRLQKTSEAQEGNSRFAGYTQFRPRSTGTGILKARLL